MCGKKVMDLCIIYSSITSGDMCFKLLCIKTSIIYVFYLFIYLRYKEDPWLWDLEWDVQDFKLKKVAASKKRLSKKAAETQVSTPLPDWEGGISSGPGPHS